MRKKSHISLAKYLMNSMQMQDLNNHKKSFYIGSILPDISPSFITTRHTFDDTIIKLIQEIKKITIDYDFEKGINNYYARHLGVVTHYLSDYCTYPHNDIFDGSMKGHVFYEKELKHSLKEYVTLEDNQRERMQCQTNWTFDEIIHLIWKIHSEYLKARKNVYQDIRFIVDICSKVVEAILSFLQLARNELHKELNENISYS